MCHLLAVVQYGLTNFETIYITKKKRLNTVDEMLKKFNMQIKNKKYVFMEAQQYYDSKNNKMFLVCKK